MPPCTVRAKRTPEGQAGPDARLLGAIFGDDGSVPNAEGAEYVRKGLGAAKRAGADTPRAAGPDDTGDKWVNTWLADRKRRGLVGHVRSDVRLYIMPTIGKHPRDWTPDDLRALCRVLDTKVQARELAWKTATNVWGTATRMCKDASRSKLEELRVRDDNPAAGVAGPDRGVRKGKQFLYPSEFLSFLLCAKVPLRWRQAVAVAVYLYPRASELRALSLTEDVDLEHGTVHIHRSQDGAGKSKPTKTKRPRRFALEPNVLPFPARLHSWLAKRGRRGPWQPSLEAPARHCDSGTVTESVTSKPSA